MELLKKDDIIISYSTHIMTIHKDIIKTDGLFDDVHSPQFRSLGFFPLLVCISDDEIDVIYSIILEKINILTKTKSNYRVIVSLVGKDSLTEIKDLTKEDLSKGRLRK